MQNLSGFLNQKKIMTNKDIYKYRNTSENHNKGTNIRA
jgi:hypothetical protein